MDITVRFVIRFSTQFNITLPIYRAFIHDSTDLYIDAKSPFNRCHNYHLTVSNSPIKQIISNPTIIDNNLLNHITNTH